jgi:protein transport protein SEC20
MACSDDALMRANSDVTDALRRTIALMQTELERSVLTTQMLDSSTASLRSTSLQHDTLSFVMTTSKQLITALEKADWLDRMLILSAFFFFLLVVLFILKQRVLDRGLRIAFWWTRFIPDFRNDEAILQELEKGTSSAVGEASSLVATLAIPLSLALSSAVSPSHPPIANSMDNIPVSTFSEPIPSSSFILNHVENPTPRPELPLESQEHEEL